jgi:hypothetical protein
MKTTWIALLAGGVLMHSFAFADVCYRETTQYTGGSMMGMLKMAGALSSQAKQATSPVTYTIMIHGGRMLRSSPHTSEIIDLDAQMMTFIDHDKRTYSMVTFKEIRDQMAKVAAKSKGAQPSSSDGSQMSFNAHISNSGATRQIDGQTATEALLTVTMVANSSDASAKGGMAATSEMWLVQDEPGLPEMRSFNARMAKELSIDMASSGMASMLAAEPGGAQALAELKKEAVKMSGLPVLQVTRVGVTADGQPLPPPSVAALPPSQNQDSTTGAVGQQTATEQAGSQTSRLGTLGRALSGSSMGALLHHAPSSESAPTATDGVLLESQTQTSGFSEAPVDPNSFQIPSGYKAVASPMDHK